MLAAKHLLTKGLVTAYGPYRKRSTTKILVDGKAFDGATADLGDLKLRREDGRLLISFGAVTAPVQVKVLGLTGYKKIFDNSAFANGTLPEIRVAESDLVKVSIGGKTFAIAVSEEETGILPSLPTRAEMIAGLKWLGRFFQSGAVHVALLALLMYAHTLEFPMLTTTVEVADEEKSQPVPVEMIAGGGEQSDFGGQNLSMGTAPTPEQQAARLEAKAQKVASGLSVLAKSISRMTLSGVSKADPNAKGSGLMAAMGSLVNGLAGGKGTGVRSELAQLGGGKIGGKMGWSLYGKAGSVASLKDQEQLASLLRTLQAEFRECYESALLKDSELSVHVVYEAEILGSGQFGSPNFSISGRSTPEGEQLLTGCLARVMGKVKAAKSLSGNRVRNEFMFKS